MSLGADNLVRMKDKAVTVRRAMCGRDRGCTAGALSITSQFDGMNELQLRKRTGITIMYPTLFPQPWQQIVWVRHSHVLGGGRE